MASDKPRTLPRLSDGDGDDVIATHIESIEQKKARIAGQAGPQSVRTRAYFVVLTGPLAGQMLRVGSEEETIIGRGTDAQLRVPDDGVSRKHARIRQTAEGVVIEDLGSSNGTVVNGHLIREHRLRDGDKVQVGSTTILKFTLSDELDEHFLRGIFDAANRDIMTKAFNRRVFEERLHAEYSFAKRNNAFLSLILLDADHFKNVNDTHGHLAGDHVLVTLARVVSQELRAEDLFARYGGEEFIVLCRGIGKEGAVTLADRLRRTIEETEFVYEGKKLPVTVSIGVGVFPHHGKEGPQALVSAADVALYQAKNGGRNRVELAK